MAKDLRVSREFSKEEREIAEKMGFDWWEKHPPLFFSAFSERREIKQHKLSEHLIEFRRELASIGCIGFKPQVLFHRFLRDLVHTRRRIIVNNFPIKNSERLIYRRFGWKFYALGRKEFENRKGRVLKGIKDAM